VSQNNIPTESELLNESNEIFEQKKTAAKHMNLIATETAKLQKVQKSFLNRLKDYYLYQGDGWIANDPFNIDKEAPTHDKISLLFIKFLQVVEDLRSADCLDFLDPYIQAMDSNGIKIYINPGKMLVSDKDETLDAIDSMGAFQKQINALSKEIKEIKAVEADQIHLTAKSEFPKLLSFYNAIESGKERDDFYQDKIADLNLREHGYTSVMDKTLT